MWPWRMYLFLFHCKSYNDDFKDQSAFRNHKFDGEALLSMAELAKTDKRLIMELMELKLKLIAVGHQLKLLRLLSNIQT
jgi:hypothetical protein